MQPGGGRTRTYAHSREEHSQVSECLPVHAFEAVVAHENLTYVVAAFEELVRVTDCFFCEIVVLDEQRL